MKLTTPMQITAADSESRIIAGKIIQFEEAANASTGKVVFAKGSIAPANVMLNLEHDRTRRIGRPMDATLSADSMAIDSKWKISNTTAGSDAIVEAMDGLRDGLSVEVSVSDYIMEKDGTMRVLAGELTGVGLVAEPAIRSARVTDVAASEEDSESTPETEETQPTEGDEVSENTVTSADAVETVEAAQAVTETVATTPRYSVGKERLDLSAAKQVEMTIKASLGNEDARRYVALAADTTDNAGLIPTRQLSTVINGLANATRSNIDAISRGTLPDAGMTFEIPKITQLPSVTQEDEGGTLADVDQNSEFLSVSVKKYSGAQTFSVELFDRSSPAFIDELMRNMAAQYAKATDTAVNAALIAGATADGTTVTTINMPDGRPVGSVGTIDGSFLLGVKGTQRFYWIKPGETDPDSLSFASAERTPDSLMAINIVSDEIWFLGASGVEVWATTGDQDLPYQRISGRVYGEGCAAAATACVANYQSIPCLLWVSEKRSVMMAQGTPTRISTKSVEEKLRSATNLRAWIFRFNLHDFYAITYDQGTLVYDIVMQSWSTWDSFGFKARQTRRI